MTLHLPSNVREEIRRERVADLAHTRTLARRASRRLWIEAAWMAALFGVTDLVCPGRNAFTLLEAPLLGLLAGWIAARLDLGRFTTSALGLVAMVALQWTSRGGLSALHLLVSFPFASTCAYLGYLREERGLD